MFLISYYGFLVIYFMVVKKEMTQDGKIEESSREYLKAI